MIELVLKTLSPFLRPILDWIMLIIRPRFKIISNSNIFIDGYTSFQLKKRYMLKIDMHSKLYNITNRPIYVDNYLIFLCYKNNNILLSNFPVNRLINAHDAIAISTSDYLPEIFYTQIYTGYPDTQKDEIIEKYLQENTPKVIKVEFIITSKSKNIFKSKLRISADHLKRAINGNTGLPI